MAMQGTLKKSVVIVNEYTVKTSGGGTRGSTPGDYVLRYMGRDGATECVAPIRYDDNEDYIMRYMARSDAVDDAVSSYEDIGIDRDGLKDRLYDIQGQGGIAFGYGEPSLSHKKLKASAKDIQKNFDNGKTVMKTVLSFDEEYLREHGLIRPDFHLESEGDYRGNIDQMKLRLAIMNGLKHLSRYYDDLQYIGVIQVDTKHVHCHLAMVDRGEGTLMEDGTQRGKITAREKADFRRGIDMYLDRYQNVKMMASSYEADKQNTVAFVKQYSRAAVCERGKLQFVIACLPEDRRLWRASSNDMRMQKANSLVRDYVTEICSMPESGFNDALARSSEYAAYRRDREGLSGTDYQKLIDNGRKRIINSGMDAVYSVLKQMPDEELYVSTPVLSVMSMFDGNLARGRAQPGDGSARGIFEFGFKMRSYKARLDHHREQYVIFHAAVRSYEAAQGQSPESRAVYDYFKAEESYNAMLVAKYLYLTGSIWEQDRDFGFVDDMDEVVELNRRVQRLEMMAEDKTFHRMKPENAENYGQQVYHESGGHFLSLMKNDGSAADAGGMGVFEERRARIITECSEKTDDLMVKLFCSGLHADPQALSGADRPDRGRFPPGKEGDTKFRVAMRDYRDGLHKMLSKDKGYTFDDVKALDIHCMAYDFSHDFHVSEKNAELFVKAADMRYDAFVRAREYLVASGQGSALLGFPVKDIMQQHETADRMRTGISVSYKGTVQDIYRKVPDVQYDADNNLPGRVRTVGLDYDYSRYANEIRSAVEKGFASVDFGE